MTERELSKFIADWPSVVKWFEDKGQSLDSAPSGGVAAALFMGSDFSAFLRGRGWTAERFGYVAGTSFFLLSYVAFERQNPEMIKQFDDAIAEARAAAMPAAEKAEMIKSLEEAKMSMLAMPAGENLNLNEGELRLVRAKYDALMRIAGASGD